MSDTDTLIETPKKKVIKKKRKPQRKFLKQGHRAVDPQVIEKVPAEFAGLNATECCNACNKDVCVISGINVCSHPMKCGLPATLKGDMETLKRYGRAAKALKNLMIDLLDG